METFLWVSPIPTYWDGGRKIRAAEGIRGCMDTSMKLLNFSVVPAPTCEGCREPMLYLKRGTDWSCQNLKCSEVNKPVTSGVGGIISEDER